MKNEIIKLLETTKVLDKSYTGFENDFEYSDWNFCIKYFNKWCIALDYKVNYISFYCFLLEYDDQGIKDDSGILRFKSGSLTGILNSVNNIWYINGLKPRIIDSPYYKLIK